MAFKEINKGAGRNVLKWQTPGQVVQGRFIGARNGKVFNGRQARIASIEQSGGSSINIPLTTVLEGVFGDLHPGVMVRVTYIGQATGHSGEQYKNFRVEVDDGGVAPFGGMAPTPAALVAIFLISQPSMPPASKYEEMCAKLREKVGAAAGKAQIAALEQLVPDQATRENALAQQLRVLGVAA